MPSLHIRSKDMAGILRIFRKCMLESRNNKSWKKVACQIFYDPNADLAHAKVSFTSDCAVHAHTMVPVVKAGCDTMVARLHCHKLAEACKKAGDKTVQVIVSQGDRLSLARVDDYYWQSEFKEAGTRSPFPLGIPDANIEKMSSQIYTPRFVKAMHHAWQFTSKELGAKDFTKHVDVGGGYIGATNARCAYTVENCTTVRDVEFYCVPAVSLLGDKLFRSSRAGGLVQIKYCGGIFLNMDLGGWDIYLPMSKSSDKIRTCLSAWSRPPWIMTEGIGLSAEKAAHVAPILDSVAKKMKELINGKLAKMDWVFDMDACDDGNAMLRVTELDRYTGATVYKIKTDISWRPLHLDGNLLGYLKAHEIGCKEFWYMADDPVRIARNDAGEKVMMAKVTEWREDLSTVKEIPWQSP